MNVWTALRLLYSSNAEGMCGKCQTVSVVECSGELFNRQSVGARVGSVIATRAPMYAGLFIRSHRATYMYVPRGPESVPRLVKLLSFVFLS